MYWLIVLFPLLLGMFSAWKGVQVYRRPRAPQQPELPPDVWDWLEGQLALCEGRGVSMRRPVTTPVSRETPKPQLAPEGPPTARLDHMVRHHLKFFPTVTEIENAQDIVAKARVNRMPMCNCTECKTTHDQVALTERHTR